MKSLLCFILVKTEARMAVAFIFLLSFSSCEVVVEKVTEQISKTIDRNDSLSELNPDDEVEEELNYIAKDYEILVRKKEGADSLFLIRNKFIWGKPYADIWYRNNDRDGLTTLYHKDGSVFYKVLYKNNEEFTAIEAFDTKGQKLNYGSLKNGNGTLKYYDPVNDHLISVTNYKAGTKEGDFIYYYQTGELYRKGIFKNGHLNGPFTIYFKNGNIKEKGELSGGKLNGEYTLYFRSGTVRATAKWKNKTIYYSVRYDRKRNKLEEMYLNGNNESIETKYYYDGSGELMSKGAYKEGKKFGRYEYYENNKMKILELWRNDTLLKENAWHETGAVKSIAIYRDNEKDSIYTEYYSSGKLKLQQEYKKGKKQGKYLSFYDNGQKYVAGKYINDKPLGKFDYYARDGKYKGANEFK